MRRFLLALTPYLLLTLAACGGTQATTTPSSATGGAVIVSESARGGPGRTTEFTGSTAPSAAPVPTEAVVTPAEGLTLADAAYVAQGDSGLSVKGNLVNTGPTQARVTRVSFELLDAAGQTIAQSSVSNLRLAPLAPGAQIPWQGLTNLKPGEGQSLRVSVEGIVAN